MIPDYQTLMRPVLECAQHGEVQINDVVNKIADQYGLTQAEREELLPSGRQTAIYNRTQWAKTYLKQAGLLKATRRGHFVVTERGRAALQNADAQIDRQYLMQYDEFQEFQSRSKTAEPVADADEPVSKVTPDEALRKAHKLINESLAEELLDRVREAPPAFFEGLIVDLMLAMGYGGTSEDAGRAIGRSGDDGVDGVIDQDPLGVDQIYIQAKRYKDGNNVGPGAIRDFFGALNIKRAAKGIFVTTSAFSSSALDTAVQFDRRMVLIDGKQLARLMVRYNIGCRDEEVLHLKKIDESFFE
jgi:restriction system protein